MPRLVTTRRVILALVALLLAAVVPFFIHLNRYRVQIAAALSSGLGRPVEVGDVTLKLLPAPGLVVANVSIGEDPAFGAEPFARMSELRANLRLRSLWTGRLRFSSLVFVEPSVNLTHRSGAQPAWNLEALANPQSVIRNPQSAARDAAFPYVEVQDGRINFKEGDLKSVLFFSGVDAALFEEGGKLHVRFKGVPSRTDRNLTGSGEVRVEGEFGPKITSPVALQIWLNEAFLSDFLTLFRGNEPGVQGSLNLSLRASGRLSALRVEGRLQVSRLYRGDVLPPSSKSGLEIELAGMANLPARRVELTDLRTEQGRVTAFGRLQDFPENPTWDMEIRLKDADAGRLFGAVRYLSPRISRDLQVGGVLDGAVHLRGLAADGEVTVRDLTLSAANLKPLRAAKATLQFDGPMLRLLPVTLPLESGPPLTISLAGDWTSPVEGARYLEASAEGRTVKMATLAPLAASLGWTGLPQEGSASLNARVEVERGSAPRFNGWITATRWRWTSQWLAQPVLVHNARLEFAPRQVRVTGLVASAGESTATGSLSRLLDADAPWQADLRLDQTGAARLGALLRIPETAGAKLPEIRARISIGRLQVRAAGMEDVRFNLVWSGRRLLFQDARAVMGGGQVRGNLQVTLAAPAPEFRGAFQLTGVPLEALAFHKATGWLSGKMEAQAQGATAREIDTSLRLSGSFTGRDILVRDAALAESLKQERVQTLAADVKVEGRRVRFTRLALRGENGDLEATGAVGFDRALDLDFRTFRLAGTLDAPRRLLPAEIARTQGQ